MFYKNKNNFINRQPMERSNYRTNKGIRNWNMKERNYDEVQRNLHKKYRSGRCY